MSAPIGTPIHHDDIFIDTANIYRGLCTLMENAGDGIFYGGIDAFCRSVYRLHKEFHKKAHVILMSYGDDDLDIEDYYRGVREERKELARICHDVRSKSLCAMVRRKIYANKWFRTMNTYTGYIFDDGIIDDTNRIVSSPDPDTEDTF